MSDDKPNPVDDLKQGLGLLFRAAKGAVDKLPTEKVEGVAKEAAREVARAFESLGEEVEKVIHPGKKKSEPPQAAGPGAPPGVPPEEQKPYDDAYAPEPPKRV